MPSGQPRTGITKALVNLREGPGLDSMIENLLPAHTDVTILEEQGEWFRIYVGDQVGFVHRALVRLPELDQRRTGITIGMPRLRERASFNSRIMTTLAPQMAVTILEENDQWLKVSVNGQEGFIHRTLVS